MQAHVTVEHSSVGKRPVALLADMRFLRGVRLGVVLQVGGSRKLLRADAARKRLLVGVLEHVTHHFVDEAELRLADLALVGPRQVHPDVLVVVALAQELFPACPASVRPLAGVRPRVRAQLGQREELLVAVAAREPRHARVHNAVRPQQRQARELAAADLARERAVARVPVPVEHAAQREPALADVARVRQLGAVRCAEVRRVLARVLERLSALLALKRPAARPQTLVPLQVRLVQERLAALVTLERSRASVNAEMDSERLQTVELLVADCTDHRASGARLLLTFHCCIVNAVLHRMLCKHNTA